MRYGKTEAKPIYHTPTGTLIKQKNSIKDLGVFMSSNAKFDTHIKNTTAAGHRIVGWVPRTFKTRALQQMLTLLETLVVSQMEYCSPLWSPMDTRNIALLERVKHRFTSKFAVFQSYDMSLKMPVYQISYEDQLKRIKICSLERRRERYMIIYVYKIVIGLVPNPGLEWAYKERINIKVKPSYCHSAPAWVRTIQDKSFYSRLPRLYNTLPTSMRELQSVSWSLAEFCHNKIVQSSHENYFNVCRQHKEK